MRRNLQMACNGDMYYVLNLKWDLLIFFIIIISARLEPQTLGVEDSDWNHVTTWNDDDSTLDAYL